MKKTFISVTLVVFLFSSVLNAQKAEGQNHRALQDRSITIRMDRKPLYTVFQRLMNNFDIPIGFEESILDRGHRHYYFETNIAFGDLRSETLSRDFYPPVSRFEEHLITLSFEDAKLPDVMDAIVRQMEHYDWEIADGVVNVFPKKGRDPRLEKLMEIKIADFPIGIGAPVGSIQAQLMLFTPEFQKFLTDNRLDSRTDRPGSTLEDRILPNGMRFSNLSFRELLNTVTKSKRGGWIVQIKTSANKPEKEWIEILI